MGLLDRIRNMGAPSTPVEADQLAIRQLAGRGADLARARRVVHFLSTEDEGCAQAAAMAARELGYDAQVAPPEADGGEWTVRASAERVIHVSTIGAFRTTFERVASETGTTYDGWEAAPRP